MLAYVVFVVKTPTPTQPDLNIGLGLTRLSLYTHQPTTTPTRKTDPMGLKFCRGPHPAKLTTTQHNFNPTIFFFFWGGVKTPGLTLSKQKFWEQK